MTLTRHIAAQGGTETEVPEADPGIYVRVVNALAAMRSATRRFEDDPDLDAAKAMADDVLTQIDDGYPDHPYVQAYDQTVGEGRQRLIEWLESGQQEGVTFADVVGDMLDKGASLTQERHKQRPMLIHHAHRYLRGKAREVIRAAGIAPLHFAIPGLSDLLRKLDEAVMAPVPEDYINTPHGEEAINNSLPHFATYDDYASGRPERRYVKTAA